MYSSRFNFSSTRPLLALSWFASFCLSVTMWLGNVLTRDCAMFDQGAARKCSFYVTWLVKVFRLQHSYTFASKEPFVFVLRGMNASSRVKPGKHRGCGYRCGGRQQWRRDHIGRATSYLPGTLSRCLSSP